MVDAQPVDEDMQLDDIDFDLSDMEEVDTNMANVKLNTPNRDQQATTASHALKIVAADQDPVFLLRMFYQRLFPYQTFYRWLNYGSGVSKNFTHREFSFTLVNDIYIRFQSFNDLPSFKKEIDRLQPIKIDIGAIYSVRPKDKKTVNEKAFRPLEKEFVLDIDMTDYDEIRTCCTGGDICHKCWEFMTISIKVIDACLREDFGFKHILWVYSGRRGVHCWVGDERARMMDNETRKAVIGYMEVIKGGASMERKVRLPRVLHPSLKRSFELIKPYFKPLILEEQGVLDTKEQWDKVLGILSDTAAREKLDEQWTDDAMASGTAKWQQLEDEIKLSSKDYDSVARDIQFQYLYPRLDSNVSTHINHLLKSPFCVHPKTQRVCVPIDPELCDEFDPFKVPTLSTLNDELNQMASSGEITDEERKIPDYKKTSLKPYMELFEKIVQGMETEAKANSSNKRAQPDYTW